MLNRQAPTLQKLVGFIFEKKLVEKSTYYRFKNSFEICVRKDVLCGVQYHIDHYMVTTSYISYI